MKKFEVDEVSLGDMNKGDFIIFKTTKDLIEARQEIDNAKDIFVVTEDNVTTLLPYKMIYQKFYDGRIKLSAKSAKSVRSTKNVQLPKEVKTEQEDEQC